MTRKDVYLNGICTWPELCYPGSERANTMHNIDRLELLDNVRELGAEAKSLLSDASLARHRPRLTRIMLILSYMREHLEMVSGSKGRSESKEGATENR